jgi:hypothetical protein
LNACYTSGLFAATVKFTLPKTLIDHEELKSSLVPPCKFGCYNLDNPKKAHFSQFPDQKEVIEELFANEVQPTAQKYSLYIFNNFSSSSFTALVLTERVTASIKECFAFFF